MGPCACVWQRVCSWQREASPASPATASCLLPPVAPGYPSRFCLCRRFIIPFLLLFPHSAAAFVYCFGISSSSPAQLTFFFSSWACQISQHISNSRRIRWSNSLCMPTLTLLWNAPHMRHAPRPTPMANRLCVLAACVATPLPPSPHARVKLWFPNKSFCYACCDFGNSY